MHAWPCRRADSEWPLWWRSTEQTWDICSRWFESLWMAWLHLFCVTTKSPLLPIVIHETNTKPGTQFDKPACHSSAQSPLASDHRGRFAWFCVKFEGKYIILCLYFLLSLTPDSYIFVSISTELYFCIFCQRLQKIYLFFHRFSVEKRTYIIPWFSVKLYSNSLRLGCFIRVGKPVNTAI